MKVFILNSAEIVDVGRTESQDLTEGLDNIILVYPLRIPSSERESIRRVLEALSTKPKAQSDQIEVMIFREDPRYFVRYWSKGAIVSREHIYDNAISQLLANGLNRYSPNRII